MAKSTLFLAICATLAISSTALSIPSSLQKSLNNKARVNVLVSIRGEPVKDVLVRVTSNKFATRTATNTAIYKALSSNAAESQKSVLEFLRSPRFFTTNIESFWITNQIYVQGADASLIESLLARDDVTGVREEKVGFLGGAIPEEEKGRTGLLAEWGIEKIRAEEVWATGYNGTGVVVGIIDTGARYTHEAIRNSYVGGTHSWFNPYSRTQNPEDGNQHGTHVTGTILGTHGVGVAPGAKWISCKGWQNSGAGTEAGLIACGQFMVCPTRWDGTDADCSLTPHLSSNSWGYDWVHGGYDDVLRAWHAAGIIPLFALGNSGAACGTADDPGDSEVGVIGCGSTTSTDSISSFSSRGPSIAGLLKPDVSAPGSSVRSSSIASDSAYSTLSGTSMATPHVAGLVALLKSKNMGLSYTQIKNILQNTADRNLVSSGQTCAGIRDTEFPNHTFGYGRINALSAISAI